MGEFIVGQFYRDFELSVKAKTRYVFGNQVNRFIGTVLETSKSRRKTLKFDQILWRAQLGHGVAPETIGNGGLTIDMKVAFSPARMKPEARFAGDGRVNPRGIPCLYLASKKETAMAEVRPWVGSYVSLAQFKVVRECSIVDCSMDENTIDLLLAQLNNKATPEMREASVWGDIAEAFSTPVSPHEPHVDYVPTQILAEAFRSHGYDGIMYKSFLGVGRNIALFDLDAAELINCELQKTDGVSYTFSPADNAYYIAKHYTDLAGSEQAREAAEEEDNRNEAQDASTDVPSSN